MALAEGETFGTVVPGFVTDADGNLSLADTGTQWLNGFWRDDDGRLAYVDTPDGTEFGTVVPGFLTDADGALVLSAAVGSRTNLARNPNAEVDTSEWGTAAGFRINTGATLTREASAYGYGDYCFKVVTSGAADREGIDMVTVPVVADTTYTMSAYVDTGGDAWSMFVGDGTVGNTSAACTSSGMTRKSCTFTPTASGNTGFAFSLIAGAVVSTIYIAQVMIEATSTPGDYFPTVDQLAAGQAAWTGTANASASTGIAPLRGGKTPGFWTDENGALVIEDQPSTIVWDGGFLRNEAGHLAVVVPS